MILCNRTFGSQKKVPSFNSVFPEISKEFPTKDKLDELFPDTPVALRRIDGHALLVNQKALDMAGITADTETEGGEIVKENGEPTGILVDNPMGLIGAIVPPSTRAQKIQALKDAEEIS